MVTKSRKTHRSGQVPRHPFEERYRELADSISDPFYSLDADLRCTYWNRAAELLTGLSEKDALGQPPAALSPNPRIAARGEAVFRRVLQTRRPEMFVTPFPGRGGKRFLEVRVYPSRSGLSVLATDITARIAQEADRDRLIRELADARDEAERRAREAEESERQLARLTQKLEHSNGELDHFASVVATDLREPLRAISGFAQLVSARCREHADAGTAGHLEQIVESARHMERLLDALLEYARLEKRRKQSRPTDLNRVLGKVILNESSLIVEHGAEITQERLPVVLADQALMAELLQNLLVNAIAFRGASRPRIHVAAGIREREHVISVSDNGIGIEARHFERIFMIFKRLHVSTAPPGSGIGLTVCRKIVAQHGGRIWVESEPGKGSVFSFAIPREPGAEAAT